MAKDEDLWSSTGGKAVDDPAADGTEAPRTLTADSTAKESRIVERDEEAAKRRRTRRPRRSTVLIWILAVLLVASAVATGVVWDQGRHTEHRRQLAVEAARQMAVALVTVNSATAAEDVREILDGAVGNFGKVFSENVESYVDIVRQGKVQTTGEASSAGLQELNGTTSQVLVAMKATVRNNEVPQGEDRTYRMKLEMVEQPDGRWLAKNVEFVP